jgi:hypothetical protein
MKRQHFRILHRVASYKLTDFSEVLACIIREMMALMMEAASTSQKSVSFYDIAEGCRLDIHNLPHQQQLLLYLLHPNFVTGTLF